MRNFLSDINRIVHKSSAFNCIATIGSLGPNYEPYPSLVLLFNTLCIDLFCSSQVPNLALAKTLTIKSASWYIWVLLFRPFKKCLIVKRFNLYFELLMKISNTYWKFLQISKLELYKFKNIVYRILSFFAILVSYHIFCRICIVRSILIINRVYIVYFVSGP